jgi:hypothetical protein
MRAKLTIRKRISIPTQAGQAGWHTSAKPKLPTKHQLETVAAQIAGTQPDRVFASAYPIFGHCCDVRNKLMNQPQEKPRQEAPG